MTYLHFARLLVFLLLTSNCNCCKILDDTLCIDSLPGTGFSTVEMKILIVTGNRKHFYFSVSFVTHTKIYSRDKD